MSWDYFLVVAFGAGLIAGVGIERYMSYRRFHANWAKKQFEELQGTLKANGLLRQERITRKGK